MIRDKVPPGEQFVWLTRKLLESDAWRSQTIHTYRLIHFLLLEHLRHGGQENGRLKAPYRQLYAFGIGARFAVQAIAHAEGLGLIVCNKAGMRTVTTFRLTWYRDRDGQPATNEWQQYRNLELPPLPVPKIRNLHTKGNADLHAKGNADSANLHAKGNADDAQNLHSQGNAPSRKRSMPGIYVGPRPHSYSLRPTHRTRR